MRPSPSPRPSPQGRGRTTLPRWARLQRMGLLIRPRWDGADRVGLRINPRRNKVDRTSLPARVECHLLLPKGEGRDEGKQRPPHPRSQPCPQRMINCSLNRGARRGLEQWQGVMRPSPSPRPSPQGRGRTTWPRWATLRRLCLHIRPRWNKVGRIGLPTQPGCGLLLPKGEGRDEGKQRPPHPRSQPHPSAGAVQNRPGGQK